MPVSVDFGALEGLSRTERMEHLRTQIAAVPRAAVPRAAVPRAAVSRAADSAVPDKAVLPVPAALADLLPHGGLVRGTVVSVSGAGSLLLGVLAEVTRSGRHAAIIGVPRLGLLAAHEMGADLSKCAVIENPGSDPTEIAAVLLDGIDLVILGLGGRAVPPSRARAVTARARSKGTTLLVTDGQWDGAELRLDARVDGYDGLRGGRDLGHGRLRAVHLEVRVQGRSCRPRTAHLNVTSCRGHVEWEHADRTSELLSQDLEALPNLEVLPNLEALPS